MKTRAGITMGAVICALAASAAAGDPPATKGKPPGAATAAAGQPGPGGEKGKSETGKAQAEGNDPGKGKPGEGESAKGGKPEGEPGKPEAPPGLAAKDDEHHKILLARFEERKKTAPDRAKEERENIRKRWGRVLDKAPAQDELKRHANTVARLARIKEIGDVAGKPEIVTRVSAAMERENARHEKRMSSLAAEAAPAAAASGGAP